MTATITPTQAADRRYRFSILRVLLFSVLMSVLVAACLYLKHSAVDFFAAIPVCILAEALVFGKYPKAKLKS